MMKMDAHISTNSKNGEKQPSSEPTTRPTGRPPPSPSIDKGAPKATAALSPTHRLRLGIGHSSNSTKRTRDNKRGQSLSGRRARRQPRIILLPNGHIARRKPLPTWKRGYVGFKQEVKSSVFVPLLFLLGLCGLATHVAGLTGVSSGYFRWIVECEGVVSLVEDDRASGAQTYDIGWGWYEGAGPSEQGDRNSALMDMGVNGGSSSLFTSSNFIQESIAGSSIPTADWLGAVDVASGVLGALTAVGHFAGVVFDIFVIYTPLRFLLKTQFRANRAVFVPIAKVSTVLLLWIVCFGALGFNLTVRESFTEQIISTLNEQGFLCEGKGSLAEEYAYVATAFGCVTYALMSLLMLWHGKAADKALEDRFQRKALVLFPEAENKTDSPLIETPAI